MSTVTTNEIVKAIEDIPLGIATITDICHTLTARSLSEPFLCLYRGTLSANDSCTSEIMRQVAKYLLMLAKMKEQGEV